MSVVAKMSERIEQLETENKRLKKFVEKLDKQVEKADLYGVGMVKVSKVEVKILLAALKDKDINWERRTKLYKQKLKELKND